MNPPSKRQLIHLSVLPEALVPLALAPGILQSSARSTWRLVGYDLELDGFVNGRDDGDALLGGIRSGAGSEKHEGVGGILLAEGVGLVGGFEERGGVRGLNGETEKC